MLTVRSILLTVIAIGLGVFTFWATRLYIIDAAPVKVMTAIEERIAKAVGGWNSCFHNQSYGPRYNSARRANPDSIISSMAYDLRQGPVRVSGETWPSYWSLSLYQQNSDNFFVVNDRQLTGSNFDFILALDSQNTLKLDGTVIISPTEKGIMLVRRFASNETDMQGILDNQESMTCAPIDN